MELKEVTISYRASVKVNLGNYESADISEHRAETWDVTGQPQDRVETFISERRDALKSIIDEYITDGYSETKGGK